MGRGLEKLAIQGKVKGNRLCGRSLTILIDEVQDRTSWQPLTKIYQRALHPIWGQRLQGKGNMSAIFQNGKFYGKMVGIVDAN